MTHRARRHLVLVVAAVLACALGAAAPGGANPRCFGAASRDPLHPCHNAALDHTITPSLHNLLLHPSEPCTIVRAASPQVCAFGASTATAAGHFALVGDSHAVHWRGALAVVARRHHWRGYSLYASRCPFSFAGTYLRGSVARDCTRFRKDVISWLRRHSEVATVVVSEHHQDVPPTPGKTSSETQIQGFIDAWAALPASVTRIIVIRNSPAGLLHWRICVARSLARHGRPGVDCRAPIGSVLAEDDAVRAARRLNSPRVRVIDMTHYFCSTRYCFPVIGGVTVIRDHGHMTLAYSRTLGPYLDRAMMPLLSRR